MKTKTASTRATRSTALVLFLAFLCTGAYAQVPFAAGTATLTADVLAFVTPIAGIAIIAVGVLSWFGRVSWAWFAGLIFGVVLVFGHQQIVTWLRGLFGV